jgi:uncharacterized damage-inducible protein DinB
MRMSDAFIDELTREAETTRRQMARLPDDKLTWKPHPKSMTLGQLALHTAMTPGQIADLISPLEIAPPSFGQPQPASKAEILAALDHSVANATHKLSGWDDHAMAAEWKMTAGGKTIMAVPRVGMVRSIMLNHWYHHRGQLQVYLRMLDVPVPSVYGPTADENPFG